MNEKTVEGVADRDAAGFGIIDNGAAHLQVAVFIEIGVHHAGTGLDDGDTGGVAHKVDEFATTAWDAEVHITYGIEHLTRGLMGSWQQGYHILGNTILFEYLVNQRHLLTVGAVGILTTFQHTGIATLEAE